MGTLEALGSSDSCTYRPAASAAQNLCLEQPPSLGHSDAQLEFTQTALFDGVLTIFW